MSTQLPTPNPIAEYEARLRAELRPANLVEDHFVHEIAANIVLGGFLIRHILADPEMANPQTPRFIRLHHTYERLTRYNYEELRRHQLARHLQQHAPSLAAQSIDTIVATHTTRTGLRAKPRPTTPAPHHPLEAQQPLAPRPRKTAGVGRNAQCPCGSGRKYKHCCLGKTPLPQAA